MRTKGDETVETRTGSGEQMSAAIGRLRSVGEDPRAGIRELKERTESPVIGYVDAYLPEELILAHGLLPYRVTVDGRDDVRTSEYIQTFACPSARNLLDQALRGDLEFLDGALFTRYCDSLRGVFAVWDTEKLTPHVDFVRYPTVTTTSAAADYLAAELREVSQRLGDAFDAPADDRRLREAMEACRRKRQLVAELARTMAAGNVPASGADYVAVLNAATTMLPDEFTKDLSDVLSGRESPDSAGGGSAHGPPAGGGAADKAPADGGAVPIVLSGVTFDNVHLAGLIEQTGLRIVGDDLSTGSRWWSMQVDDAEAQRDPWRALARAYLERPPCSVKEPSEPRTDHLLAQVRASGAKGVVFYLTKFCDSEQVEWPYVRDRLEEEGIPVTVVEGEHRAAGFEQARTRLEAFRERIDLEVA